MDRKSLWRFDLPGGLTLEGQTKVLDIFNIGCILKTVHDKSIVIIKDG